MKYNINNNSIDIEYIANGKRNQLKLNNDDAVDMDFFNQLMKANSNKRDAMCDLFKRKILKEDDGETIHIQPLKLDKELKPSKYAEKVELQRRKAELERDKQHIAEEAKVLLKEEAKKKDITTLTKDDLNNENDLNKLKEIQARYIEIDKVHKMIINQLDSLEIGSADQVNIKELKNLTVNAFDNINKQLVDAKISEKDKQDIADSVANLIKPNYGQIKRLIDNLKNQLKQLRNQTKNSHELISDNLLTFNNSIVTLGSKINEMKAELPKSEIFEHLTENLESLNDNIALLREHLDGEEQKEKEEESSEDDSIEIKKIYDELSSKINTLEQKVEQLPKVFNEATIETREQTLIRLAQDVKFRKEFRKKVIDYKILENYFRERLPIYNDTFDFLDYDKFLKFLFEKGTPPSVKWQKFNSKTIEKNYQHLAFLKETDKGLALFALNESIFRKFWNDRVYAKYGAFHNLIYHNSLNFYYIPFSAFNNKSLADFAKILTLANYGDKPVIYDDPPLYLNIWAGVWTKTPTGDTGLAHYPQFIVNDGDKDLLAFFGTRGGIINHDEEKSGKINIDLNQSSTNEKLNEIIRLLSQLNYNVFTTTPMYKQSIQSKKKAKAQGFQTDSEENEAENVDLYDVLDL